MGRLPPLRHLLRFAAAGEASAKVRHAAIRVDNSQIASSLYLAVLHSASEGYPR